MLIKTLNIKVSFQWAFEDNQRWTATDHVRQTVPGARCCDGVQCGSFVQLMALASQCICSWVKMKPYCRTGLNPLHLPLPCVDVAYCYTCCSTLVCSVCSVSSAKTYEPTTSGWGGGQTFGESNHVLDGAWILHMKVHVWGDMFHVSLAQLPHPVLVPSIISPSSQSVLCTRDVTFHVYEKTFV